MSFKYKTNVAFFAALISLVVIGWFSFQRDRSTKEYDQLVVHSRDVLQASELLRSHIYDAAASRRAYLFMRDSTRIDAFNQAYKWALDDFATLRKLTADNVQQQVRLVQIEPVMKSRLTLLKTSMELHESLRDDAAQQDALNVQNTSLTLQVTEMLDDFDHAEQSLLRARIFEAQASNSRKNRINAFLGVAVFLFLILTLGLLNRELHRSEQAERRAAEQKELLQAILDSCSDAVIVADTSGKIILRNPVGVRYNGDAPAEELSENYPRLLGLYKEDRETLFRTDELPLSRALAGESANGLEMCVRSPGGAEPRWMLAAGGPLLTAAGARVGGVVFLRDITALKKADRQLTLALQESETLAQESMELSEFGDALQSCQTIDEAFKMTEQALPAILGNRPGALCILNSSRDLVESVASWKNCTTTEPVFHPDNCWALRRGKPHGGPGSALPCSHTHGSEFEYLCIPLIAEGETMGILYVEDKTSALAPSTQAIEYQQATLRRRSVAVAERVSLALANLRLRELLRNQSIRDPLTGLYNRRYFEESLNRELHRASRTHRALSLVMVDLDHFKHFNDTFGHQVGDILLKEVAGVIKTKVRAGDLACRYGGEEFSIILAEVDLVGAHKCLEHISESIRHLFLSHRGQTLGTITVSAGIAAFPGHGDNPEDLIRAADEALYKAKKAGRDRIVIYEPLESSSAIND